MKKRILLSRRTGFTPSMRIGFEVLNAHRLTQRLAAGDELAPAERQTLNAMPKSIQQAIKACWRANSRYLPNSLKKRRQIGRRGIHESPYEHARRTNPKLASALDRGDKKHEAKERWIDIDLPGKVFGFGAVVDAFARHYARSTRSIYSCMSEASRVETKAGNELDGEEPVQAPWLKGIDKRES